MNRDYIGIAIFLLFTAAGIFAFAWWFANVIGRYAGVIP